VGTVAMRGRSNDQGWVSAEGKVADEDVADDASTDGGNGGEDRHAEDIELLSDGWQGAGEHEREDSNEVERGLDDFCRGHWLFLTSDGRSLVSQGGRQ